MEGKDVVNELVRIYHEHKLAHAYLLETNNVQKCYEDVLIIVKNIFCPIKKYVTECNQEKKCNICSLIDNNNLPSLITIEPDGKNIKKDAVDKLKSAFSMVPIYTDANIYVMKYPEKMNNTAYNKMLKFLEEPEDNLYGFFICENRDNVAATIVSRCETLKCLYFDGSDSAKLGLSNVDYERNEPLAQTYLDLLNAEKEHFWYNIEKVNNELITREDCISFLKILNDKILNIVHHSDLIYPNKLKSLQIIQKYLEQLNYNVNINLLLQSFNIEMGDIYEK